MQATQTYIKGRKFGNGRTELIRALERVEADAHARVASAARAVDDANRVAVTALESEATELVVNAIRAAQRYDGYSGGLVQVYKVYWDREVRQGRWRRVKVLDFSKKLERDRD